MERGTRREKWNWEDEEVGEKNAIRREEKVK